MWVIKISDGVSMELEPWSCGFTCWRRDGLEREAVTGHLQVTLDWLQHDTQLAAWLATAPADCVQAARPFSSWAPRLLSLAARFAPCRQLLVTNPNLLWLAAWADDRDEVVAQAVAAGPLALLAALGLRHRPSSLRILKQLCFESSLRWQRQALLEWLQPGSLHWGSGRRHHPLSPSTLLILRKAPLLLNSALHRVCRPYHPERCASICRASCRSIRLQLNAPSGCGSYDDIVSCIAWRRYSTTGNRKTTIANCWRFIGSRG